VATGGALYLLSRRLPDIYLRSAIWLHAWGHNSLRTIGIEHMPTDGPVLLVTNCNVFRAALDLVAGVDRFPRIVLVENKEAKRSWLRRRARRSGLISVPAVPGDAKWAQALQTGNETLRNGEMVALTVNQSDCVQDIARLIDAWRTATPTVVIVPVYCTAAAKIPAGAVPGPPPYPRVIFGPPLPTRAPLAEMLTAIDKLASSANGI